MINRTARELIWLGGKVIYQKWFNLKCYGKENLPRDRGYIIAANHTSHLDAPAVIAALEVHLDWVYSLAAQDYFFNNSVKSWLCHNWLNMIPFKRRGKFLDCLPACQEVIGQKKPILFFPEGTRSTNGRLQPLKLGIGILAIKLNVPIVPTYIQGTFQALPKGKRFPKKCSLEVTFGSPLESDRYLSLDNSCSDRYIYQSIARDVYVAIGQLQSKKTKI